MGAINGILMGVYAVVSDSPYVPPMEPFVQFGRELYEEHFCEIILNLDCFFVCLI